MITPLLVAGALALGGAHCQEDDPCWTWLTMGDLHRGVLVDGRKRVVGPCGFAHLVRAHRLDVDSPHLRGDYTALRLCREV